MSNYRFQKHPFLKLYFFEWKSNSILHGIEESLPHMGHKYQIAHIEQNALRVPPVNNWRVSVAIGFAKLLTFLGLAKFIFMLMTKKMGME